MKSTQRGRTLLRQFAGRIPGAHHIAIGIGNDTLAVMANPTAKTQEHSHGEEDQED